MRKAADAQVGHAQTELARMYQAGIGVERDNAEAKRNYRNAARGGDCEAMAGLAIIYDAGLGGARNAHMAQVFYELAARDVVDTNCPGAADEARIKGARLDAAALAGAQAMAAAWKVGEPLPDEVEEGRGKVR
jgi:TPR repeat protein